PTAELSGVKVYRSDVIPSYLSGGLAARACDPRLLSTLDGHLARGVFLNDATAGYPATVLGYEAARTLGIADLTGSPRIYLGWHPAAVRARTRGGYLGAGRLPHRGAAVRVRRPPQPDLRARPYREHRSGRGAARPRGQPGTSGAGGRQSAVGRARRAPGRRRV